MFSELVLVRAHSPTRLAVPVGLPVSVPSPAIVLRRYSVPPRSVECSPGNDVAGQTVKVARFAVERLVDLARHDYQLEPNVTFTPDNKWIVFRANMHGATHTYAVDVARSN